MIRKEWTLTNLQGDQKVTDSGFNNHSEPPIYDGLRYFTAIDDACPKSL